MDICKELMDKLTDVLNRLKEIHADLEDLENTGFELDNEQVLETVEDIKILLKVLRINGKLASQQFEKRISLLQEDEADR